MNPPSRGTGCRPMTSLTGLGLATPLGLTPGETYARVQRGECGMGPAPALEQPLPSGANAGQCPDLPADYHPRLPREARYLRWAIEQALAQAAPVPGKRIALILGTTLHGMRAGGRFLRTNDSAELSAFLAGDTLRLATDGLPITGLRTTTCSACSSSLGAIALADTWLRAGQADVVLAGGYDPVSEYAFAGFSALRVVSGPPLRPFAKGREGMKLSEGYAIVAVERAEDAASRAIAHIAGWGESADAHHLTRPEPTGRGALAAMRQALRRAGVTPDQLSLIAAHATGTPDNDASEAAALTELLGGAPVPVVGFKSHLGHTLGGAGAAELILSALALQSDTLPPTAGAAEYENEFPALQLTTRPQSKDLRHTLNTSLGFGGANTCVVLAKNARSTGFQLASAVLGAGGHTGHPHGQDARATDGAAPTQPREVLITGIGVLLPGAIGTDAFLAAPPTPQTTLEESAYEHLINARRTRRMSPYVKLQLAAIHLALAQGNLSDAALLRDASAMLATTHGSASYCYDYYSQVVREGVPAANPMLFAEGVPNAAAAQASLMLGLQGGCQTLIGTTTAGLEALALAAARIATGAADRILVGAAEEAHFSLDRAYAYCAPGSQPSCAAAVAFLLESRESASARQALPLAHLPTSPTTAPAAPPFPWPTQLFSVAPLLALARSALRKAPATVGHADRTGARASVTVIPA